MAHASGVQWYSYSTTSGMQGSSTHASIHNQQVRNKRFRLFADKQITGIRVILVAVFILLSLMFGAFIQKSFGSEEGLDSDGAVIVTSQSDPAAYSLHSGDAEAALEQHVVLAGDTLWAIARSHAPEGMDIREYIYKLKNLNAMEQSVIYEGQVILLP